MVNRVGGDERIGIVAILADIRRTDVRAALANGIDAVMAAGTIIDNTRVIEVRRPPRNCCVAVIAGVAAGDMCRVLAGRNRPVMAGVACANDLRVIDSEYRRENICRMTVFANIAGRDVRDVLTRRIDSVMAVDAVTRDIQVIEIGGQPADSGVAIVAVVAALDVILVLAGRRRAVMAGAASAQHLCVIDGKAWRPNVRGMAVLAHICC